MSTVRTEDLDGAQLDWAVAQCLKKENILQDVVVTKNINGEHAVYSPFSSSWGAAGPIIERERINLYRDDPVMPKATLTPDAANPHHFFRQYGETILIAAMRCFVAYKLGDKVDIPDEVETSSALPQP